MIKMKKQSLIFLIALLILLGLALYFLYITLSDFYAKPIPFIKQKQASKNETSFPLSSQFYPNMRFPDKNINYNIDISCQEGKITRIASSLNEIETETGLLKFIPSAKQISEIFFSCTKTEPEVKEEYFIAGEGGPTSVINNSIFYVIQDGKVLLFYEKSICKNHNIELHEVLHVLGFQHSQNKNSIMYPTSFCNQVLTNDIINELKRLYSIQSLPDLYFSEIIAEKKGRYLNFNITIRNQGLKDAEKVALELYSENKKIDEFDFKTVSYGEGRILSAENVPIPRETEKIRLIIVSEDELDKENNVEELTLSQ